MHLIIFESRDFAMVKHLKLLFVEVINLFNIRISRLFIPGNHNSGFQAILDSDPQNKVPKFHSVPA